MWKDGSLETVINNEDRNLKAFFRILTIVQLRGLMFFAQLPLLQVLIVAINVVNLAFYSVVIRVVLFDIKSRKFGPKFEKIWKSALMFETLPYCIHKWHPNKLCVDLNFSYHAWTHKNNIRKIHTGLSMISIKKRYMFSGTSCMSAGVSVYRLKQMRRVDA